MQLLFLLMVSLFHVTFATPDVAFAIKGDVNYLHLKKKSLNMMHMCLCNTSHSSCRFNTRRSLTLMYSESSQIYSRTQYSNRYTCSLHVGFINCTRRIQSDQKEAAIKHEGKSFSLHGNKTCDINCVHVVWDDTVGNVLIDRNIIRDELCASSPPSITQNMMNTKLIVIIAAENSVLIVFIILVIIAVCVRIKRKRQVKKAAIDTVKLDAGDYLEVYNTGGLYDVSTDTSSLPYLNVLPETHYQELE